MIGVSKLLKYFGIDDLTELSLHINKLHTSVNEWNFDRVSFMVDLRIDI